MRLKNKKGVSVIIGILIFIVSLNYVFSQPYSSSWFVSGSEFNLDSVDYQIVLGGSRNDVRIQLRYKETNTAIIYKLGDCYSTNIRKVCFRSFEVMDNEQFRVRADFYRIYPNLTINKTVSENSLFIGEDFETEIIIDVKNNDLPEIFNVTLILPPELEITSRDFKITKNQDSVELFYENNDVRKRDYKLTFRTLSDYGISFSSVGKLSFEFEGDITEIYSKPERISFNPHYNVSWKKGTFNQSKPLELNLTISNEIDSEIFFNDFYIYFPKDLEVKTFSGFTKMTNSGQTNNFQVFHRSYSLSDEDWVIPLEVTPLNGSFSILTGADYRISRKEYSYFFHSYDLNMDVKEEEIKFKNCTGKDFNISSTYNSSKKYFPGNDLNFIIYSQNIVDENISNVRLSVKDSEKLIAQRFYEIIYPNHRKNAGEVSIKIPFTKEISLDFMIEYFCDNSEVGFIHNETFKIPVGELDNIVIKKEIEKKEIEGGSKTKVTVSVENKASFYIHNLSIKDSFSKDLISEGSYSLNNFAIKGNSEIEVYSYFLTSPVVNQDTNFQINSTLTHHVDGQNHMKEEVSQIKVLKTEPAKLKVDVKFPSNNFVYEPIELKIDFENEDSVPITNISFNFDKSNNYDISLVRNTIPDLFPKQSNSISVWILPKHNFDEEIVFNVFYYAKGLNSEKENKIKLNLNNPRTKFPALDFEISIKDFESGLREAIVLINNPSDVKSEFKINGFNQPIKVNINENEIYENTFFVDKNVGENLYLTYSFLGREYVVFPKAISFIEETLVEENELEEPIVEEIKVDFELDQKDKNLLFIPVIIIVLILFLATGIITFKILKSKKEDKLRINEEHVSEVIKNKMEVSDILSGEKKSEIKKEDSDVVSNKEIKPSSIFTYDEYEKFKENLENNVKGKSEDPYKSFNIKKRNPFLVFLLGLITFGIYNLVWLILTTKELKQNTSCAPNPIILIITLIPILNIFVMIYYLWKYSKAINEFTNSNSIIIFILLLFFSPIGMLLTQISLNKKA